MKNLIFQGILGFVLGFILIRLVDYYFPPDKQNETQCQVNLAACSNLLIDKESIIKYRKDSDDCYLHGGLEYRCTWNGACICVMQTETGKKLIAEEREKCLANGGSEYIFKDKLDYDEFGYVCVKK